MFGDMQLVARNRMFDDDDDDSSSSGGGVGLADRERPEEGYRREYPNKLFVQETLAAFPDAGIADVEQARVCVHPTPLHTPTPLTPGDASLTPRISTIRQERQARSWQL